MKSLIVFFGKTQIFT